MTSVRLTGVVALLTAATFMGEPRTRSRAPGQGDCATRRDGPVLAQLQRGRQPDEGARPFHLSGASRIHVSGKVTCYFQEATRAVFTGPVTKEANPDNDTQSFVVMVTDGDPALAGADAFDVAGGGLLGPDCPTNVPARAVRRSGCEQSLYYVTSGDIVVR